MGFLAPLWLALATGAAVPLVLHLLRRQTGARVAFPAARYLARAEQEHSRKLRLRHLLLMLLRVAAVLLLATAAAGPVAAVGGGGHAPVALAVVLDNSLSTTAATGGAPALDALRAAAARLLGEAGERDRVWLVTADGRVRGGTGRALAAAAVAVAPLDGRGDVRGAAARAAALAGASGLPPAVAVATDAQASAWGGPLSLGSARVAAFVPPGAAPADHGVAAVAARPARWSPSGTVGGRVVGAADSVGFRVLVGAAGAPRRPVAAGAALAGRDSVAGAFETRVSPGARGWLTGVVSIAPDEFRGDDSAFFAAFAGDPPAVRALPDAGPFVAAAIASLVARGQARPPATRAVTVAPADAAVALPAVLFAPASPVRIAAANRALERLGVPWRFGAPRAGAAALAAAPGASSLGGAVASARYALAPTAAGADARVLATAAGDVWAAAGPGYVLVASPADPAATTLPVLAAWPPWLAAALGSAGGAGETVVQATPGARVAAPAGATALVDAAGRHVADVRGTAASAPGVRGVYFFSRGDGAAAARVAALVVNPEAEELVLDRLNDGELARRLGATSATRATVAHDAGDWSRAALAGSARRPVSGALLALGLLCLVAESATTRAGTRRGTRRGAR